MVEFFTYVTYIGVFVIGVRFLSRALQTLLRQQQIRLFHAFSERSVKNWLIGSTLSNVTLAPAVVQVLAASYLASGFINFNQALSFMLGAHAGLIGLSWIILLLSQAKAVVIIAIGVFMFLPRIPRGRELGQLLIGAGFVIWAMQSMAHTLTLLVNEHPFWLWFLGIKESQGFVMGLFAGILFTLIFPISYCGLAISFSGMLAGVMSLDVSLGLVAGELFGLFFPLIYNFGAKHGTVKKVLVAMLAFSVLLVALWWVEYEALRFSIEKPDLTILVLGMTLFSLTALVFLPLVRLVDLVVTRLMPIESTKLAKQLEFASNRLGLVPYLASELVKQEVRKLANLVRAMFDLSQQSFSPDEVDTGFSNRRVGKYSRISDHMLTEVQEYVAKLIEVALPLKESGEIVYFLRIADHLERIADHCRRVVALFKQQLQNQTAKDKMSDLFATVSGLYDNVVGELVGKEKLLADEQIRLQFDKIESEIDQAKFHLCGTAVEYRQYEMVSSFALMLDELRKLHRLIISD